MGGTVELFLTDGTKIKPKVVAIYGRGMGFGDILLPRQLMLDHSQSRLDTLVLVRAKPRADHAALGAALTKLAGNTLGVRSADPDAVVAAERQAVTLSNLVNLILLVGLFGYLAINVVNTLVMTTFDRRRELALLRLVGTTAEQVTTLMRIEAIVVVGIAVVIGTALSLPPLIGVRLGLSEGQIATPVVSLPTYLFAVAGTAVLGLASILLPARSALRGKPIETIGIRE